MNDTPVKPVKKTEEPKKQTVRRVPVPSWIVAIAAVLGLFAALGYSRVLVLQVRLDVLETTLIAEQAKSTALSEQVAALQQAQSALADSVKTGLNANISQLENQYIVAASARLEATVAREIAALGTSGFRFNMVEFDRRSCALGGTFSGEHPDGFQQDEPFDPNYLVEVLQSSEDVRGVPFYRIKINGATLQWQGSPAIFRHGRMRIECN